LAMRGHVIRGHAILGLAMMGEPMASSWGTNLPEKSDPIREKL
jgi:hypothetical protein